MSIIKQNKMLRLSLRKTRCPTHHRVPVVYQSYELCLQSENPCCLSELRVVLKIRESLLSIRATSCAYNQRVPVVYQNYELCLQSESPCCLSELRVVLAIRESLLSVRATSYAYNQTVPVVYQSGPVMLGTHSLRAFQWVQIAVDTSIRIPTFFRIVHSF